MAGSIKRMAASAFALCFLAVAPVFGQFSSDVNHRIYDDIDLWEGAGYVRQLPPIRPYPEPVLREILAEVVRRGSPPEAERAAEYLSVLEADFHATYSAEQASTSDLSAYAGRTGFGASMEGRLGETVDFSGSFTGFILDLDRGELLPASERTTYDIIEDNARVTVGGREIETLMEIHSSVSWGTADVYAQGALSRRSFGPFHEDSVVLSNYAYQAPGFAFSFNRRRFSYNSLFLSLRASTRFRTPRTESDLSRDNLITVYADDTENLSFRVLENYDEGPGKFLYLNSCTFNVNPRLSLSFFESVVFGPTLQAGYLIPLKLLHQLQGIVGFFDNSYLGISADYRVTDNLRVPFIMYVDDANFNELVRLNLDTKMNFGLQTGAIWTPLKPLLKQFALHYTAVTPYMYAHDGPGMFSDEFNYTNYLHGGTSLGSALEPNSDRLMVKVLVEPLPRLSAEIIGRLMHHANASEGVVKGYGNDGSIYDDGRDFEFEAPATNETYADTDDTVAVYDQGRALYSDFFGFLTQDHIETTWQAGIDLSYLLSAAHGSLSVDLGYFFEYIRDPIDYVWDPVTYTGETISLPDETNHYMSVGMKYVY